MLFKALLAILLCVIGSVLAEQSPVLLWGVPTETKPSLDVVTKTEFANLVKPLLEKNAIIVFLEEDLSARDLSCHNLDAALSCYAHLRRVSPKSYYANVESPIEALSSIVKHPEYNNVDATGKFAQPVELKAGNVYFVNFDTQSLQRGPSLEAHDATMEAASKQLAGNVVFLYLSGSSAAKKETSISSRVRRETAAAKGGYIFPAGAQFLLFFTELTYKANGDKNTVLETVSFDQNANIKITNAANNNNKFSASLVSSTGKTLSFNIVQQGGYYEMMDIAFDGVKFQKNSLSAPLTFSFHCTKLTLNAITTLTESSNARLNWHNLQFQAPFGTTTNEKFVFGDGWDCVYFFTPGILSALFVIIVLLMVLFVGICWMMDINTMDRFEDPKGKTITVNTGE